MKKYHTEIIIIRIIKKMFCRFYVQDLKRETRNTLPKERRLPWLALNEVSSTQMNDILFNNYMFASNVSLTCRYL